MRFYKVLVGDQSYHGQAPLTYHFEHELAPGSLVSVPLRKKIVPGIIAAEEPAPSFKTKPIAEFLQAVLPASSLKLIDWMGAYYPAPHSTIVQLFVSSKLTKLQSKAAESISQKLDDLQQIGQLDKPSLTAAQQAVVDRISGEKNYATVLLHGQTGSGKTRIYIELARRMLAAGRSAIILTPEISLTPQLTRQFSRHLGGYALVTHSAMTDVERREVWQEIVESARRGVPRVIIGPRSALFMPLPDVGLIVLDEAHETAYKQDQAPRYQTTRVAAALASVHQAALVLGSATPSVVDYYTAAQKHLPILNLERFRSGHDHVPVSIETINLTEKEHFASHRFISTQLMEAVRAAVGRGEQALIFLNRRGTARLVLCEQCGWQARCPECDLPLTYHGDSHLMLCHTCGHKQPTPSSCPECGYTAIIFKSFGTKALADFFTRHFPHKQVARFDMDNPKAERLEARYADVRAGRIDILVGTQILAKGLDLPKLSVVGVVAADTSLYLPDYTSDERTWQLLHQVIGRVGRRDIPGKVIIQSYHPESPAIQAAVTGDWELFYDSQLMERRQFLFPPFVYLLKLTCSRKSPQAAEQAARKLKADLIDLRLPMQIEGPAPSFHEKRSGQYQWQLVVKARKRTLLTGLVPKLPANWTYDLDPNNLL